MNEKKFRNAQALAGWLALVFLAGWIGAAGSLRAPEIYRELVLPAWAPPAFLFGPVWLALYVMMGVAAWLVWRAAGFGAARGALTLFVLQLAPNALWSWLFFAWRRPGLALADLAVLWIGIVATLLLFRRVRPLAAALLAPYLAWVSFAGALNAAIWRLNAGTFGP